MRVSVSVWSVEEQVCIIFTIVFAIIRNEKKWIRSSGKCSASIRMHAVQRTHSTLLLFDYLIQLKIRWNSSSATNNGAELQFATPLLPACTHFTSWSEMRTFLIDRVWGGFALAESAVRSSFFLPLFLLLFGNTYSHRRTNVMTKRTSE